MMIYHYFPSTGVYLGEGQADANQLQAGAWLLPAFATFTPPPAPVEGQIRVFDGTGWLQAPVPPVEVSASDPRDVVWPVSPD